MLTEKTVEAKKGVTPAMKFYEYLHLKSLDLTFSLKKAKKTLEMVKSRDKIANLATVYW